MAIRVYDYGCGLFSCRLGELCLCNSDDFFSRMEQRLMKLNEKDIKYIYELLNDEIDRLTEWLGYCKIHEKQWVEVIERDIKHVKELVTKFEISSDNLCECGKDNKIFGFDYCEECCNEKD